MFQPDWLILRILHQSFEIERPKGHYTPIPLDGASATIRNFGQKDANRSRNGKSVVAAQ